MGPKRASLGEVFDSYRARLVPGEVSEIHREKVTQRLDSMLVHFGGKDRPAEELTIKEVNVWKTARLSGEDKWQPTTLRNYMNVLRAAYRQAIKEHLIDRMPFEGVSFPPSSERNRIVPLAHLMTLRESADPKNPADVGIMIAMFTGLRRGDIMKLDWRQIDFDSGIIHLGTQKTGDPVDIPLAADLAEFLFQERQIAGKVFNPPYKDPSGYLLKRTKALVGAAYGFHIFRHTYLTSLARAKVHPRIIQDLAGHRAAATTMKYIHTDAKDAREAVALLPFRKPVEK
jgi:integrase